MYGLPSANEMDPTIFVALTYTFIFGAMFGDVGQGFCLFVIGGILYLTKKMNLAGIISVAGLFSMFFGFMFGSIFGFEDIIEPIWLRPAEAMTNLPFIGQLNTVFIVAVAFGMGLNILGDDLPDHQFHKVRGQRRIMVLAQRSCRTCVLWILSGNNCTVYDRA